jgi:putative transcriptional regulator
VSSFASLRGHLLVAAPDLLDPNFRRSVVLLTEHDEEAAMGVVLNRRLEIAVVEAVPALAELVEDGALLHQGGPVQTASVLALADFREPSLSAGLAFGTVGYLRGDDDPAGLVGDVSAVRVFSGYSGWGPGQLEAELAQEAWITLAAVPDDVFGDPDGLWSRVLERKGGHYRLVARMPDDPSLN